MDFHKIVVGAFTIIMQASAMIYFAVRFSSQHNGCVAGNNAASSPISCMGRELPIKLAG